MFLVKFITYERVESFWNFLKEINFHEVVFLREFIYLFIFFTGCKFCSVLRGFFFADGEILIIPCGLIFAVIQTLLFYSFYSEIVLRKTSTKILREFAFADGSIRQILRRGVLANYPNTAKSANINPSKSET